MIQPDEVASLRSPAQSLHPPFVILRTHGVPIIERVTPALAGGAKSVRRDPRNCFRFKVVSQTKQFSVRPYVSAVIIHENRNVTNYADQFLRTVQTQGMPLL